jgi:hypothetical protein
MEPWLRFLFAIYNSGYFSLLVNLELSKAWKSSIMKKRLDADELLKMCFTKKFFDQERTKQ